MKPGKTCQQTCAVLLSKHEPKEYDRFQIRGPAKRGQKKNPFRLLILLSKMIYYVSLITEMLFTKLQVFRELNDLNLKKRLLTF